MAMDDSSRERSLAAAEKGAQSPPQWKPGRAEWLVFFCMAILSLIVALDTTAVAPVLPILQRSLDGNATSAFWVGTSYLLSSAIFQPFIVKMSDIFSRRILLFVAVFSFTLGTVLSAAARGFPMLLAGRTVQGFGGGGIIALCLVITTDMVPLRQRPAYYTIVQMAWAIGSVAGPVVGGAIADNISWRWVFYINLPFCCMGMLLVPCVVRIHAKRGTMYERLLQIDWVGVALFNGSVCGFLMGITWGGIQFPWRSWHTVVPIVVGVVGVAGALVWERYFAKHPFVNLSLFRDHSSQAAYACICLQGAVMFGLHYFLPLYFQGVKGFSAVMSGVGLMIIAATLVPLTMVTGILLTKFGSFRWALWIGWAITTLSTGLLILWEQNTASSRWVPICLVLGIGHGMILTAVIFCVQAYAKDQEDGEAAGMYSFIRTLGMCIGVAAAGSFFQNRLASHLQSLGLSGLSTHDAADFALLMKNLPDGSQKDSLVEAYSQAFKDLYVLCTAISGLAGILSAVLKHASMDRELDSEHILERDEGSR